MKTLREYIDIINEISRRDFLRGAGAAAGLAAIGNVSAKDMFSSTDYLKDPRVSYIVGWLAWCSNTFFMFNKENTPEARQIIRDVNKIHALWDQEEEKALKPTALIMQKENQQGRKDAHDWFTREINNKADPAGSYDRFLNRVKHEYSKLSTWNK